MYKEVPHTADVAYEITFFNNSELFNDLVDIIRSESVGNFLNETREETYNLSGDLMDDVFDIANEMIYMVDRGWVPEKAFVSGGKVKIVYRKTNIKSFKFKAMTYHMSLREKENKKILKVVFDV